MDNLPKISHLILFAGMLWLGHSLFILIVTIDRTPSWPGRQKFYRFTRPSLYEKHKIYYSQSHTVNLCVSCDLLNINVERSKLRYRGRINVIDQMCCLERPHLIRCECICLRVIHLTISFTSDTSGRGLC